MKIPAFLIILAFLFANTGCKESIFENPEVDNYIALLKNGQYNSYILPEFTPSDISALLYYRNDTTTIYHFPMNPISSFAMMKCTMGMVVLWTVESIRAVETKSDKLVLRFPSQNPLLAYRENPGEWVFNVDAQFIAAKAYYKWWNANSVFSDKMKVDPLKDTKYIWH
jgi:hypothetical protein